MTPEEQISNQIKAFNEGYELGLKLAKEIYED